MDEQALRFEEHRAHLGAVAYRMLGSRSDADDAARNGDFDGLLAVLDSDVVLRVDAAAAGTPTTIRGAQAVAANARSFSANARFAEPALVDGAVGIVVAPKGRLALVLRFAVVGDRIAEIDIDADPARLGRFSLAVLD